MDPAYVVNGIQWQSHRSPPKAANYLPDNTIGKSPSFGIGPSRVDRGGVNASVTQLLLDLAERDPLLNLVHRSSVAEITSASSADQAGATLNLHASLPRAFGHDTPRVDCAHRSTAAFGRPKVRSSIAQARVKREYLQLRWFSDIRLVSGDGVGSVGAFLPALLLVEPHP
jgi:hypothetical protein